MAGSATSAGDDPATLPGPGGEDDYRSSEMSNTTGWAESSSFSYSSYDYYQGIDWTVQGPATTAYALIFLLGVVGNSMVIFAICRCRRLHTATSLLLANLAAADLLLLVLLIPVKVVVEALDHWPIGDAMCRILSYINVVSPTCSIYTLTVIALERCYAVLFPLETKSMITMGRTKIAILVVWVFSLAMCIPGLFSKMTRELRHGDDQWTTCNDAWPSDELGLGYAIYVTLVIFVLPILVLAACYTLIIIRLCSGKRLTKHMRPLSAADVPLRRLREDGATTAEETECLAAVDGGEVTRDPGYSRSNSRTGDRERVLCSVQRPQRQRRTEAEKLRRIVTMLIVVVVVFILCWGPLFVYGLLLRAGAVGENYTDEVWKISLALHLLAYGNSCVNPFIYAFMSESFREGFAMACRAGCLGSKKKRTEGRRRISQQSSHWTTTTRTMSLSSANALRVQ